MELKQDEMFDIESGVFSQEPLVKSYKDPKDVVLNLAKKICPSKGGEPKVHQLWQSKGIYRFRINWWKNISTSLVPDNEIVYSAYIICHITKFKQEILSINETKTN